MSLREKQAGLRKRLESMIEEFAKPPQWNPPRFPFEERPWSKDDGLFSHLRRQLYAAHTLSPDSMTEWIYRDSPQRIHLAIDSNTYPEYSQAKVDAGDNGFKCFVEDKKPKHEDRMLPFLVSSIHPDVTKAVIMGNVASKRVHDAEFNIVLARNNGFTTTSGIYYTAFARVEGDIEAMIQRGSVPTQPNDPDGGKGFSVNQLILIVDKMELYLKRKGDKESSEYAQLIDQHLVPTDSKEVLDYQKDPDARRYRKNDNQEKVIRVWMRKTKQYIEKAQKWAGNDLSRLQDLEKPLEWNVCLVGYGNKCVVRARQHVNNESTGVLWGLTNAIQSNEFGGQFYIFQIQLMYICSKDHVNLAECLGSVLASSYHDEMGMNGKRGGAIGDRDDGFAPVGYHENILRLLYWGVNRSIQRNEELCRESLEFWNKYKEEEQKESVKDLNARVNSKRLEVVRKARQLLEHGRLAEQLHEEAKLLERIHELGIEQGVPKTTMMPADLGKESEEEEHGLPEEEEEILGHDSSELGEGIGESEGGEREGGNGSSSESAEPARTTTDGRALDRSGEVEDMYESG